VKVVGVFVRFRAPLAEITVPNGVLQFEIMEISRD
jgi:hypothetical protein